MQDLSVDRLIRSTIYKAVQIAGKSSWEENAKLKMHGEKRILTRFPQDPTIRWKEWKQNPANFS
jgi:hypothetical protein